MPWYKVTATIEVHVEADDEYQARDLATDDMDLGNTRLEVEEVEVDHGYED